MKPDAARASELQALSVARADVCAAAKGVLLAIDGFLQENDWPDMPFGVHRNLVVLGEKMVALDEVMANREVAVSDYAVRSLLYAQLNACPECGAYAIHREWCRSQPKLAGSDLLSATDEERAMAAKLQERAEELRDGTSETLHRIVRATEDGWVEIRADYLGHLLDRIEYESGTG